MHAELTPELSSIQEVEYDGGSEFQSDSGDDNYTFESGDDCSSRLNPHSKTLLRQALCPTSALEIVVPLLSFP